MTKYKRRVAIAALVAGALSLSACSGTPATDGATQDDVGVPYGASPEEFAAALADMTPVTLTWQTGISSADNPAGSVR